MLLERRFPADNHPRCFLCRELFRGANAVQRAVALAGASSELKREAFLPLDSRWRGATEAPEEVRVLRDVLRDCERDHIRHALELTGGHKTQTADLLGISRKALWEKLRDLELE